MRKQLFYLTNTELTAYIWQGGRIVSSQLCCNNETGWQTFAEHIAAHRNVPAYLLTDLVEEDFQRETIPHVTGKARATLIQRRLLNLYRDTPYRHAQVQGRDKEGRKDDRLLLSALTNAELPKPWLNALLREKVPLVGIYSVALIEQLLFKKLDLGIKPVLLVTQQSSGLRTSYFQEGQLRFSRLTLLDTEDPKEIAQVAETEIAKTRQFMASTRLVARGESMDIDIIATPDILQNLQHLSADSADLAYRLFDLHEAPAMLGLKHLEKLPVCDRLFLSLLAQSPPPNQYPIFEHIRFYAMWRARLALSALRVVTVLGGLLWAGLNGINALDAAHQAKKHEIETSNNLARYQELHKSMPVTLANPHDMKSAVDLAQTISENVASPDALLATISSAMAALPQIRINTLEWAVSETDPTAAAADPGAALPQQSQEAPLASALVGLPKKPFEIVTIEGEVIPFENNYRTAQDSVQQFATALRKNPQLHVDITQQTIDTRPSVRLEGQAGSESLKSKALFQMKLVWKP